jgi:DNA-directed RNA polymerase specialized sigma24 family protein
VNFESTRWSLVAAAGGDDSVAAREALGALCEAYWYPLYAFVRRRGVSPDDARDLTQGFLTSLLERSDFERLHPDRGRFRAFLLASLKHFLANDAARTRALKRGGGLTILPLALDGAEGKYGHEPIEADTPERLYERRWALTVIDRVMSELHGEWTSDGRGPEFEALKAGLVGDAPVGGYAGVGERLGMTEGAVKVAVHRLRRRFQSRLRQHIADTVADPADVDDEIAYLVRVLTL